MLGNKKKKKVKRGGEKKKERRGGKKYPDEGFVQHVHLKIDLCNSKVIRIDGEKGKWWGLSGKKKIKKKEEKYVNSFKRTDIPPSI